MRSWCPRTISTGSTDASRSAVCSIGRIRGAAGPARSTTTTAAVASTSRIRPGIIWKSSPGPTDQVVPDSGCARVFQDDGYALAGADAHTKRAIAGVALTQLGRQRQHIPGPAGPERMADGDGAAVVGELLVRNRETAELILQLAEHAQRLRAERLMHFPHVDPPRAKAGTFDRNRQPPSR